ncbi:autophagy-related protein 5 [Microdochium nivale]|nr:autophagy-related protein 5 [Microdochium nivale]
MASRPCRRNLPHRRRRPPDPTPPPQHPRCPRRCGTPRSRCSSPTPPRRPAPRPLSPKSPLQLPRPAPPRLGAFFAAAAAADNNNNSNNLLPCSSFHHEGVLLRNLAVGLLADLYQPTLPWRLTVAGGPGWDIADTFLNSAKEADFVRNGNAQRIMSLSKEHTTALWNAVQDNDYPSFNVINTRLLNSSRALKHVPLRIYIPQAQDAAGDIAPRDQQQPAGSFRVVQSLVPIRGSTSDRTSQTLGTALRSLLPTLFPARETRSSPTPCCTAPRALCRAPRRAHARGRVPGRLARPGGRAARRMTHPHPCYTLS